MTKIENARERQMNKRKDRERNTKTDKENNVEDVPNAAVDSVDVVHRGHAVGAQRYRGYRLKSK